MSHRNRIDQQHRTAQLTAQGANRFKAFWKSLFGQAPGSMA
jgi:hypothetical protein